MNCSPTQDCRNLLERLKRDQAALQSGAYAVSTCPICLEELQAAPDTQVGFGDCSCCLLMRGL